MGETIIICLKSREELENLSFQEYDMNNTDINSALSELKLQKLIQISREAVPNV